MSRRQRSARVHGFTLIEILGALVVLGMVMAALTQGVRFGLSAWTSQARTDTRQGDLDAADRVLRELIAQWDPYPARIGMPREASASRLAFLTELPLSGSGLRTRRADVVLTVERDRTLVLLWREHFDTPVGQPRPLSRSVLLDGVSKVDFSYWHPAGRDGPAAWVGVWSTPAPPPLVRIRITFADSGHLRWPDIVAAPMRERKLL